MLRTFYASNKHVYQPGQHVTIWNGMPDRKQKETYQIVKLISYSQADKIGEYEVRPVDISKDSGNLYDKNGHPSPGLR